MANIILKVGYTSYLMSADDAAKVASLLAQAKIIDTEHSYSQECEKSFSELHWTRNLDLRFEAAPDKDEVIHENAEQARTAVRRKREAAEAALAAKKEQERALTDGQVEGAFAEA